MKKYLVTVREDYDMAEVIAHGLVLQGYDTPLVTEHCCDCIKKDGKHTIGCPRT